MADPVDRSIREFYDRALELESADPRIVPATERAQRYELPREGDGRIPRRRRFGTTSRIALIAGIVVLASATAAPALDDPISDAVVKGAANLIEALREHEHNEPLPKATRELNDMIDAKQLGTLLTPAGEVLVTTSRGERRAVVSVTPTSNGGICMGLEVWSDVIEPTATPGCVDELDRDHPMLLASMFHPWPSVIGGVLHPDIVKVEVDSEAGWIDVEVTRNAFVWLPPLGQRRLERVRATFDDGERIVYP
ncbi:MAG: hypothetical protein JWM90_1109 [Thermoleophilia bacterium]|nr:hypothetical protein [Thermoleophilia bacterium]